MNKLMEDLFVGRFEKIASIHEDPSIIGNRILNIFPNLLVGGTLITVGGKTGMGKTVYGINLLLELAKNNFKPSFFTLGTKEGIIADSILCVSGDINYSKLQKGELNCGDFSRISKTMECIDGLDFNIVKSHYGNLNLLFEQMEEEVKDGSKIIIIDYIQLLFNEGKENRTQEISSKIRKIKHKAMELNIVIIVLSQLNRDVDKRIGHIPALSDFRDSGSLEEDSDIVYGLYREEYYDEFTEKKGILNIYTLKNRFGDTYGKNTEFFLNMNTGKISNIEKYIGEE